MATAARSVMEQRELESILPETTAVDLETGVKIQKVIKAAFQDSLDEKFDMLLQKLLLELAVIRSDLRPCSQGFGLTGCPAKNGLQQVQTSPRDPQPAAKNGLQQVQTSPRDPPPAAKQVQTSPRDPPPVLLTEANLSDGAPSRYPNLVADSNSDDEDYPSHNSAGEHFQTRNFTSVKLSRGSTTDLKALVNEEGPINMDESAQSDATPRSPWKANNRDRQGMRALVPVSSVKASTLAKDMVDKMVIKKDLAYLRRQDSWYQHALFETLVTWVTWWHHLDEPVRKGWLAAIVKTKTFEILCISVIFINSAFLAIAADWEIQHIGQTEPQVFVVAETVCSIFFILELIMRLGVHRWYFFVNNEMRMNCFDFAIVTLGTIDLVLMLVFRDSDSVASDNFVVGRIFRLIKLAKMFRTIRALRFFRDIVVILEGIKNSLLALFWIFIMLGMLLFIFSLVFLQGMIDFVKENEGDLNSDEADIISYHFGSQWRSTFSLYAAVTGGNDWFVYYEIVAKIGTLYAVMFVGFTFFFLFAMFNVLTGLFVEKAAVAARPDAEEIILAQNKKAERHAHELKNICILLDADQSGCVSWSEFENMMSNPTVVAYMASIGLEVHEPDLFFAMVCDSAGVSQSVPIEIFVERCMQFKGLASSIDSQRLLFELHAMKQDVLSLTASVHEISNYQSQPPRERRLAHERQSPTSSRMQL